MPGLYTRDTSSVICARVCESILVGRPQLMTLPRLVSKRVDDVGQPLVQVLGRLQNCVYELQLCCISPMDGQACKCEESAEIVGQTRQVICGA